MKLAVIGSRDIDKKEGRDVLWEAVASLYGNPYSGHIIRKLVSGGARGGDELAIWLSRALVIPMKTYQADWEKNGKAAGFMRNVLIADNADQCLALWNGESKGTRHTIDLFLDRGKEVHVFIVPRDPEEVLK